jgi:hypothetical protein
MRAVPITFPEDRFRCSVSAREVDRSFAESAVFATMARLGARLSVGSPAQRELGGYGSLRYAGYANMWGFAIWLASKDGYEDSVLPNGHTAGTAEEALDCACGLYLNDPTAWLAE